MNSYINIWWAMNTQTITIQYLVSNEQSHNYLALASIYCPPNSCATIHCSPDTGSIIHCSPDGTSQGHLYEREEPGKKVRVNPILKFVFVFWKSFFSSVGLPSNTQRTGARWRRRWRCWWTLCRKSPTSSTAAGRSPWRKMIFSLGPFEKTFSSICFMNVSMLTNLNVLMLHPMTLDFILGIFSGLFLFSKLDCNSLRFSDEWEKHPQKCMTQRFL